MKNLHWIKFFLLFTVFFAVLSEQNAKPINPQSELNFEEVLTGINHLIKSMNLPSVAVAKDGEIIWEESFGLAHREKEMRATPHTMYSLASI